MAQERTYLTALNEASENLTFSKDDLVQLARALHMVGNDKFADTLATIAKDLSHANALVCEGRDLALKTHVRGAAEATENMIKTALAVC